MKKTTNHPILLNSLLATVAAFALSGCGVEVESPPVSIEPETSDLEAVLLEAAPADPITVLEARKTPTPGAEITVIGKVAGVMDPFSAEYATLVLADNTMKTCDMIEGDNCPTPWDACCASRGDISSQRLTVQVNGADGKPLEGTLKGTGGMKELDELVITGTVAEGSNAENLIVNASGIYRKSS